MNLLRTLVPAFLLLVFVCTWRLPAKAASASPPGTAAVQQQVLTGIDAMYDMRFDDARTIFDALVKQQPDDPTGYYFRASIHLWKYLFDKNDDELRRFISESDRMIEVAEEAVDKDPRNSLARTYIGAIYGYRAMANIQAENFLKASWDARNCYNYLSETLEQDPNQYEAYLGMGIFNFLIGALPEASRTVMNLAGISGNKEKGLKQLQIAAEKAQYARNDARMVLGLLHVYYRGDYSTGLGYLKGLLAKYPNNIPLLYALGNIEAQLKKMDNAIGYYKKVLTLSNTNFRQFTVYSNFRMGEAYFRLNDFNNSRLAMQKFIKANTGSSFKAIGLFRLAQSNEMLGNRSFAVQLYERTTKCTPITAEDRYAVRRAKNCIGTPMSEREIQLVRGVNNIESLQFEQGEPLLRSLVQASGTTKEQQAEAQYHIGEAMRQTGRPDEALSAYQKVIQINPEAERWLVPWSYFRMSQVYAAQGNQQKARASIDRAKVFTDYDFREWLIFQIERDISTID